VGRGAPVMSGSTGTTARTGSRPALAAIPGTGPPTQPDDAPIPTSGRATTHGRGRRSCPDCDDEAVPARSGPGRQPRAWRASISFGMTLCTSPTIPRSATWKIGASWSLLMATMFFEFFMPTMCWVAPEMPQAT